MITWTPTPGERVNQQDITLLFSPRYSPNEIPINQMHVVAFASGSGTNFREAVKASREQGNNSSIDYLLTDKKWKVKNGIIVRDGEEKQRIGALDLADEYEVPYDIVNGFKMCGSCEEAKKTAEGQEQYHQKSLAFNQALYDEVREQEDEQGFAFDFMVLAGYMRYVLGPLYRPFANRGVNIHPARLDVLNDAGIRIFIGDNAVYDALVAGEERTRSSLILIDPEPDAGAILFSGKWLEYKGSRAVTKESADDHQEEQKKVSDWPTLCFGLKAIAAGEVGLHKTKRHPDGNPVVVYKGIEMPYEGVDLEKIAA